MLIGELAEKVDLPARTVRFYERRGLLPEPRRAPNGYRIYDETTLDRLRFIRSAQSAGLTLAEIRSVIDIRDGGVAPCAHVDALLGTKLREVRDRRTHLEVLEHELEVLVDRSSRLDPADCKPSEICQILQLAPDEDVAEAEPGWELRTIEISRRHRRVQAAGFALLLSEGRPVGYSELADRAGIDEPECKILIDDFATAGRVRFDEMGRITGIGGLSVVPTRHTVHLGAVRLWTWCALDAVGIIAAMGATATFTTLPPDTECSLVVEFVEGKPDCGPGGCEAAIFLADGYGDDSVADTWCPMVNMFPTGEAASAWAETHGVAGRCVIVSELVADAAAMWLPVVSSV